MKIEENRLYGGIAFGIFILVFFYAGVPFQILGIDIRTIPEVLVHIYSGLLNVLMIVIITMFFKDYLVKAFKDFKKNKNEYFKKYFKLWFLILLGNVVFNLIINSISGSSMSGNEEEVRNLLTSNPFYMWVSAVLIAPILEEFVFRLSFRNMIKNKWLFILLSGFTFGAFHLIGNVDSLIDLLYIFPYSIPGMIFAYILYDSKNIFNTVFLHMFHNGILTSLEILLLLLGVSIV